ncbi:serine/threonine protein kinase [Antheraea pernyi nucleopolyhedrovirus]|uniref:Protein kinase 1 n=3 Tax=Antheraea pernyi nuclear polyhedrosis virus TaxID=161494 RepID=Q1HH94_NPVAP|nr:serine/threonine protein kinase [Antheraea pernyi nucleopolyhedrovirus]AWD33668.1 protein kinase 1 [Antheraea proylei nucleopolyhedrovirus]BBD50457.1 protein kinase 1 [Antheraea yamamai nucleopolyhedrovirus]BBD50609.1 protein kinase 1 [Samia cynthia nucleopolyhedrovirus]ABF50245.1 serine/threonine protein kinase [Antheraea pernyi nucleopolyhedrovirus]ABQ12231.1 protein kinase 1 [Antheraea pernyi nucleopolyhedrovirus]
MDTTLQSLVQFTNECALVPSKMVNGRFGKIDVLYHRPTSKLFLRKTIAAHHFNADEVNVHDLMVDHPNFVSMYFSYGSPRAFVIVMDYVQCPDLFETLQAEGALDGALVANIVRQLCGALNDLHVTAGYIHNDVKLENVLYFRARDRVYLCDYGLCRREHAPGVHDGTLEYFSPEKIRRQSYARSFDWYAVGVLTYKLLTGGRHPFERSVDEVLDLASMKRRQQFDIAALKGVRGAPRDFVYGLTRFEFDNRLTNYRQIARHDFLKH